MTAGVEKLSYNVPAVTFAELMKLVGELLQRARLARKWKPIDVERAGGPSYKTVQAIEDGDVGTVDSLDKYATALNLSAVDIFSAALSSREVPLSPEAAHVVRKFEGTTIAGRTALLSVANALPAAETTTPRPPIPAGAVTRLAPRQSPPGPPAKGRRTAR